MILIGLEKVCRHSNSGEEIRSHCIRLTFVACKRCDIAFHIFFLVLFESVVTQMIWLPKLVLISKKRNKRTGITTFNQLKIFFVFVFVVV